jgi:hypothetical protein
MKAHEALTKIRVMLGMEPEVAPESVELAEATLVDGTVVKVDGELAEGKSLVVVTEEGDVPAPRGVHETSDGMLITVDDNGVIVTIEEKPVEEAPVEMESDEAVEPAELAPESKPYDEAFLAEIAGLIAPLNEKIAAIEAKFSALDQDFHQFRDEPAAGRVKNNLVNSTDSIKGQADLKEARLEKLLQFRKQK